MSVEQYDVIVVGAGPAGATAAYGLARAGLRTLLLEKARLPRYKTCGGGITHKSAAVLPFSIEPVVERTLRKFDISWRTEKSYVREAEKPLVYMVQRSRFDNYLTEHAVNAGATLVDETTVQSLDVGDHEVNIFTSRGNFKADYVIGADGATGRVAKSLDLMADRWAIAALETEFEVESSTMDHWRDKLGLDLGEYPATYGWVFPKGDHLSVGVGGLPRIPDYGKRLTQMQVGPNGGGTIVNSGYGYDAVGNVNSYIPGYSPYYLCTIGGGGTLLSTGTQPNTCTQPGATTGRRDTGIASPQGADL